MSIDFKANQLRTSQIIVSGTNNSSAGLLIYGSSSILDTAGAYNNSIIDNVGNDVFLFVSGTTGTSYVSSLKKSLFGGDVVISGSIYNGSGTKYSVVSNQLNELSPSPRLNTTASMAFAGAHGSSYAAESAGSDVFFFVSGSSADVALFTGYLVSSGTFRVKNTSGGNTLLAADTGQVDCGATLSVGTDLLVYGNSQINGNATITGNLTVNGSTTTISSSNLVIKDPLIYIASGGIASNQGGGIAIASGSSVANQSLVFGRVDIDTWGVGRKDVVGGTSTDVSTNLTLVPMRASKFEVGALSTYISSSDGISIDIVATGNITSEISTTNGYAGYSIGPNSFLRIASGSVAGSTNATIIKSQGSNDLILSSSTANLKLGAGTLAGAAGYIANVGVFSGRNGIFPAADSATQEFDLGAVALRWKNIYTGDLHLKNERGDWSIIEEEDYLSITNNKTGKRYKFVLEEI